MKNLTAIKIQLNKISHLKTKNKDVFEFHINKNIRDNCGFDLNLFTLSGNVIFANYNDVIKFAFLFNKEKSPDLKINPGYINAMGLVDEIYHYLISLYNEVINPNVINRTISHLIDKLGEDEFNKLIYKFTQEFPPADVYNSKISIDDFLNNSKNVEITFQEIILLHFANINPAFARAKELFTDIELKVKTIYSNLTDELENFFSNEIPVGEENLNLLDFLKTPINEFPDNLDEQLKFIKKNWGLSLSPKYFEKILVGINLVTEEQKYFEASKKKDGWTDAHETFVPVYKTGSDIHSIEDTAPVFYQEYEKFTIDTHWMPKVVLIAKNIYVWLDQLSKKYNRSITKLNQIPDDELDILAKWNFTGLWLIGVWERSSASRKIKNYTGNPEAASSAYSLFDYEIAKDLGGEEAFQDLNQRTKQRSIRLACDMVPNHTGIYSKWINENPDYFIQLKYPPYPNYSFTGPDLSENPNIIIKIEDGYWSKRDASVVFKREDRKTGEINYIYHGNDGTNMPWNDTAQLNFLKHEVREAVIQNILSVARKFSIIRFDAAMTLTKKHFQRLWYPTPGSAGDIPSRAGLGIKSDQFDASFPEEFWREVVDRFNQEMPNTLLLAEAFWLMEGYFVRTLGMHRVYNSAFMNMIMKEENSKYIELIKNTLEFNPEILKRYVNFLSNPDEETSIKQFGDGDKYFGVTILMITMPGLPMFAHGQIEGYHEKYGMEYRKAYYNEFINDNLVRRHEYEIFPLLKKRYLFSQVDNFDFYQFINEQGQIDENVFAFSNMINKERVIVFYHNKFSETSGRIKISVPKAYSLINDEDKIIKVNNLGLSMDFQSKEQYYYTYKDYKTNLEYIQSGKEFCEKGFFVSLKAYEYHIFLDFKEVSDSEGYYKILSEKLQGKGTTNIEEELIELKLSKVHNAFSELTSEFSIGKISDLIFTKYSQEKSEDVIKLLQLNFGKFIAELSKIEFHSNKELNEFNNNIRLLICFVRLLNQFYLNKNEEIQNKIFIALDDLLSDSYINIPLSIFKTFMNFTFDNMISSKTEITKTEIIADLRLDSAFLSNCSSSGITYEMVNDIFDFIRIEEKELDFDLISNVRFLKNLDILVKNSEVKNILKTNTYQGITYLNKEKFEQFIFDLVFYHIFAFSLQKLILLNEKPIEKLSVSYSSTLYDLVKEFEDNNIKYKELILIAKKVLLLAQSSGYKSEELKKLIKKQIKINDIDNII